MKTYTIKIDKNIKAFIYIYIYIYICIYLPTPLLGQDMTQGQFFKWSLTGFPSSRLVVPPRLKNLVCPTIYP